MNVSIAPCSGIFWKSGVLTTLAFTILSYTSDMVFPDAITFLSSIATHLPWYWVKFADSKT